MRLWHYTAEPYLEEILDSEVIKLATSHVPKGEKPAVWFSSNGFWEHTVTKMIASPITGELRQMTFDEMVENLGCARIEIEVSPLIMTYGKFKHKGRMNLDHAYNLEKVAIDKGANPDEWYVSLKPITIDYWIKAEVLRNGKWELYEEFVID